jgi:WD40 repeat protein
MQTNLVSWNPSSQSQFISYSQNKLRLLEFSDDSKLGDRSIKEIKAWEASQLQCLDWRPPGDGSSVLAYGTSAGTVHLVNAETGDEVCQIVTA